MKLYIVWEETSEGEQVPIGFFLNYDNAIQAADAQPE
jgi:hypothetical protein